MSTVKQGWIEKKGQSVLTGYKKRWLVLHDTRVLKYYVDDSCKILKGSIFLSYGYKVQSSETHNRKSKFGFEIISPDRTWYILCASQDETRQWIKRIDTVMNYTETKSRFSMQEQRDSDLDDVALIAQYDVNVHDIDFASDSDHKSDTIKDIASKKQIDIDATQKTDRTKTVSEHIQTTSSHEGNNNNDTNPNNNRRATTDITLTKQISLAYKPQENKPQNTQNEELKFDWQQYDEKLKRMCPTAMDEIDDINDLKCFCGADIKLKTCEQQSIVVLCEFCGKHKVCCGVDFFECDAINNKLHPGGWSVCACCCYHQLVRKYYDPITDLCPRRIGVTIDITRVSNICTVTQSFRAKLQITHSWKPTKAEVQLFHETPSEFEPLWIPSFEFPNVIEIHHTGLKRSHWSTHYTILTKGESNGAAITPLPYLITGVLWIDATFSEVFELEHFPLDCQDLTIKIQSGQYSSVCEFGTPFQGQNLLTMGHEYSTIPEWNIRNPKLEIVKKKLGPVVELSQINVAIKLERIPSAYFWRMGLFLILITAASLVSFSMDAIESGSDRIAYLITLLLTAVAYQFAALQDIPKVPYLTLMDKYILQTFLFIFAMLIQTATVLNLELEHVDKVCHGVFWGIFVCVQIGFIGFAIHARSYELNKLCHVSSDMDKYCTKKRNAAKTIKMHKFGATE